MKTLTISARANKEQNFRFGFNHDTRFSDDSKSLQVWEEENPEYASWNLISDSEENSPN
jgi:hypothetical protein